MKYFSKLKFLATTKFIMEIFVEINRDLSIEVTTQQELELRMSPVIT